MARSIKRLYPDIRSTAKLLAAARADMRGKLSGRAAAVFRARWEIHADTIEKEIRSGTWKPGLYTCFDRPNPRLFRHTHDITQFASYRKVAPRQPSPDKTAPDAATHCPNSKAKAGEGEFQWAPMRKTLPSLGALREAMGAANRRYLGVIRQWPDHPQHWQTPA